MRCDDAAPAAGRCAQAGAGLRSGPLQIAMIGRYYNRQGGTSRCLAELAERAGREHAVDVFAHEILAGDDAPVRFVAVPMRHRPLWLQGPTFERAVRVRLTGRPYDVVHAHEGAQLGADIYTAHSCYAAWLRQRRAEAGALGLASHVYPPHVIRLALIRRGMRERSSLIIAVSGRVRDELIDEMDVDPRRVTVVHNGTDTREFRPPGSREEAFAQLEEPRLRDHAVGVVLLFVAYEFRKRGLERLIRALARLGDPRVVVWVIGGDDPAPYRRLASRLGVADRLQFLGHRAHVRPYFQAADAFVLPTEYEAFGLVILEAMACGRPVVTSRRAGAAELIADEREGMLVDDPHDLEELVSVLRRLVDDGDRRSAMGAAGRRRAEQHSWDAVWRRTADVYERVVAAKQAGLQAWQEAA